MPASGAECLAPAGALDLCEPQAQPLEGVGCSTRSRSGEGEERGPGSSRNSPSAPPLPRLCPTASCASFQPPAASPPGASALGLRVPVSEPLQRLLLCCSHSAPPASCGTRVSHHLGKGHLPASEEPPSLGSSCCGLLPGPSILSSRSASTRLLGSRKCLVHLCWGRLGQRPSGI